MNPQDHEKQVTAKGLAYLVTVYLIWGSTYLAIRFAVREGSGMPPFALGAMRMLIAGPVLLAWGALRKMRVRLTRSELITLTLAGLLMWPGANGLVSWAEQRADSSYAALLVGAVPIWTTLIDSLWRRQRPSWRLLAFLVVGFAGIGLLAVPRLLVAEGADLASILMLIAAPIAWSIGSLLQIHRPVAVSPLVSSAYLHLLGGVGFVILFLATREPWPSPTAEAWGALTYLTIAGSIIAFTAYVRTLHLLPTHIAMTFAYVNPVVAAILGWIILREDLSPIILAGMGLVLFGVWGIFREKFHHSEISQ
ncbi:MAG: EamA family transporter [Candidatus Bipolaricaulota bacterium]